MWTQYVNPKEGNPVNTDELIHDSLILRRSFGKLKAKYSRGIPLPSDCVDIIEDYAYNKVDPDVVVTTALKEHDLMDESYLLQELVEKEVHPVDFHKVVVALVYTLRTPHKERWFTGALIVCIDKDYMSLFEEILGFYIINTHKSYVLSHAIEKGNLKAVKLLYSCDSDCDLNDGGPMQLAVLYQHAHICRYLLEEGVSPYTTRVICHMEKDSHDKYPAHPELKKLLPHKFIRTIYHSGCNVNALPPCYYAKALGNEEILKLLKDQPCLPPLDML
jgi:hypothetical protein